MIRKEKVPVTAAEPKPVGLGGSAAPSCPLACIVPVLFNRPLVFNRAQGKASVPRLPLPLGLAT